MYGEEKGVQRNIAERAGQRNPNRSPGESNATKPFPSFREDVGKSVSTDVKRIGTALNPSGTNQLTREAQQAAGARAISRMFGRAVPAVAALEFGYAVGKFIDNNTGVGSKIVDRTIGKIIDKYAVGDRDKVELTERAKEKLDNIITDKASSEASADAPPRKERTEMRDNPPTTDASGKDVTFTYAKGGYVRKSNPSLPKLSMPKQYNSVSYGKK